MSSIKKKVKNVIYIQERDSNGYLLHNELQIHVFMWRDVFSRQLYRCFYFEKQIQRITFYLSIKDKKMKRQIDLSNEDLEIIIKALSYLCVATHSRPVYIYAHDLESKLKEILLNED